MGKLPKHILDAVGRDATSLGKHPAFPPEDEDKFAEKLVQRRYDELFGGDEVDTEDMKRQLSELLTQIAEKENAVRNALMALACAVVNKVFHIPADTVELKAKLVDEVDTSSQRLLPEKMPDFSFDDIDDMENLGEEIYKRRMLDALVCGAMAEHENDYMLVLDELFKIDPDLPPLYKKALSLNERLMFIEKEDVSEDETPCEAGKVDVVMDMPSNSVSINAEAVMFPVLLGQIAKGLFELAIAHGLPEKRERAEYVIGKADFRLAENWDIRLGIPLWKLVKKNFEGRKGIEDNFVLMEIAKLPVDDFNRIMREVFAGTKRGLGEMQSLADYIERGKAEDEFNDYMSTQQSGLHQIEDSEEYFTADELMMDPSPYLNESAMLLYEAASLSDIKAKYYNSIPDDVFQQIVAADPTYSQEKPDKMGKFGKWLLGIYMKGNLKTEDLYKATQYLSTFVKFYNKIENKDIMKHKSLQELYNTVQPFMENPEQATSKSDEVRQLKNNEADKVYEDSEWLVVVPKTKEAACYYGKGTEWCTAATKSDNMFDYYNEQGPLYINISKKYGSKYQFHFETKQFMDERDWEVHLDEIGLSDGLIKFYRNLVGDEFMLYLRGYYDATPIDGAPGYYMQDNYETEFLKIEDSGEVRQLNFKDDYGYYIEDYNRDEHVRARAGRYIHLTTMDNENLYDLQREDLVFESQSVREVRMNIPGGQFLIVFQDGESGLFDPKSGEMTETFEQAIVNYEGHYNNPAYLLDTMTINPNDNPYVGILRLRNRDEMFAFYDLRNHKFLTEYVYQDFKRVSMMLQRQKGKYITSQEMKFMAATKEDVSPKDLNQWEVILPDGRMTTYAWLAQHVDELGIPENKNAKRSTTTV